MQAITPFLWFDHQAEEAATFYVSTIKDSKILATTRYDGAMAKASGMPEGSAMTVEFELAGQHFTALNGGPEFHFTEAVSFVIHCDTQEDIDRLWETLTQGGQESQCGWLKDKFGLSWQIVPDALMEYIKGPDPAKAARAMQAMLGMKKLDIDALRKAYEGA